MGMYLFKLLWTQGKGCDVDDLLMHMNNSIRFNSLQGNWILSTIKEEENIVS